MRPWQLRNPAPGDHADNLRPFLPAAAARVLEARGISTLEQLHLFLQPPHRLPYCPMRLSGMEAALKRLVSAINRTSSGPGAGKVGIVGDFDVDGITGAAILAEGLEDCGLQTEPYLPHRVAEGHGLSAEAVEYLAGKGVELIVTVDCGVSSCEEVELAGRLGIDVIVTDHHVPPEVPPRATAIINPRMPGSEYPYPHLCGAGLAFKLMQGLYQLQGRPLPPSLAELAALGTIADLVPLLDENRYLVKEGLVELGRTRRPGLQAMYRIAGLEEKAITAETVSFQIAPRLNAAGRMGHAYDSLRLLTTRSEQEADTLAYQLEAQNRERQSLTRRVFAKSMAYVESLDRLPSFIIVSDPEITPGVAGLVAGRMAEAFGRPSVALASVNHDSLMASGRSIPGFNLIEALNRCADLFVRHGGHPQAAGFTMIRQNLPSLAARLEDIASRQLGNAPIEQPLEVDTEIRFDELTPELVDLLNRLEPFGEANPKPRFMTCDVAVTRFFRMGDAGQHLKLLVNDGRMNFQALAFNRAEEWPEGANRVDLVYTLSIDRWKGKEQLNLIVEDFRAH